MASPTNFPVQARPTFPVLVKTRVCVCAQVEVWRNAGTTTSPQRSEEARTEVPQVGAPAFPATLRGSARAQRAPRTVPAFVAPARPKSEVEFGARPARRYAQGAFLCGRHRPLSALSSPPSLPRASCHSSITFLRSLAQAVPWRPSAST